MMRNHKVIWYFLCKLYLPSSVHWALLDSVSSFRSSCLIATKRSFKHRWSLLHWRDKTLCWFIICNNVIRMMLLLLSLNRTCKECEKINSTWMGMAHLLWPFISMQLFMRTNSQQSNLCVSQYWILWRSSHLWITFFFFRRCEECCFVLFVFPFTTMPTPDIDKRVIFWSEPVLHITNL